jgi:hypothetical protein
MPPAIFDHLTAEMTRAPRSRWPDRCLLGAIGAGLAASVVIASMLWVQSATTPPPAPSAVPAQLAAGGPPQRAGDYLAMFARADANWAGFVR